MATLKAKCEEIESKERARRAADDEKHAEEVRARAHCPGMAVLCDALCHTTMSYPEFVLVAGRETAHGERPLEEVTGSAAGCAEEVARACLQM